MRFDEITDIRSRIAGYEDQMGEVRAQIDRIDQGWRFQEAYGNESLSDVTDRYRGECVARLGVLDDAKRMWERQLELVTAKCGG